MMMNTQKAVFDLISYLGQAFGVSKQTTKFKGLDELKLVG